MTVGILEREGSLMSLPVLEIHSSKDWYDYEARYTPGLSVHDCPAKIPDNVSKHMQNIANNAHLVLGCRDLSRADFVLTTEDEPYLPTSIQLYFFVRYEPTTTVGGGAFRTYDLSDLCVGSLTIRRDSYILERPLKNDC